MSESMITKQAIATGFKQLMNEKTFDKITILDITKTCDLNRQTFYYHFHDKYELLNWIFYTEVIQVLTDELSFDTWPDNLYSMLTIIKENDTFYRNAINHSFQEEFRDYLLHISETLFCGIIEHMNGDYTILPQEDKKFLARFLSYGVVDSIIWWIKDGMIHSPLELKKKIVSIVNKCKQYATNHSSLDEKQ
ncbi:dihydroxyacetone kinase transcriptional activator DhaS [Anaerosporobacter sp.]|uniref:dihydroxyacetone kinase transcriptional activator DhaS n=1 Tax=Anaerosporobacter sp. TaxID=1872529 RepID=UPI00286F127B|nr:dihydroxyacetone kinase transcriptional activator DhaS [Anaerosporobacter sp.]